METVPHFTMHDLEVTAMFLLRNLGMVMRGEDREQLVARLQREGYDAESTAAYVATVELIRDMVDPVRLERLFDPSGMN